MALLVLLVLQIGIAQADYYSTYKCLYTEKLYKLQLSEADHLQLRLFRKAEKELQNKLKKSRSSQIRAEIFYCLGTLYSAIDRHEQAIKHLNKSKNLEKSNPMPFAALGGIYEEIGQSSDALVSYERALALDETLIFVSVNAARLNYTQGQYGKALELLSNSESYQKEKEYFISGLILEGDIYHKLEKHKQAVAMYLNSLSVLNSLVPWKVGFEPRLFPKEFEIYRKIIESYCLDGQVDMVHKYYEQALRRNSQAKNLSSTCLPKKGDGVVKY